MGANDSIDSKGASNDYSKFNGASAGGAESVYWSVIDGIRVQGKLDSFPYCKIVYVDTLIGGKSYKLMKKVNCMVAGAIEDNDTIYAFDYARGYELKTLESGKKVLIVTNKNGTFVMD